MARAQPYQAYASRAVALKECCDNPQLVEKETTILVRCPLLTPILICKTQPLILILICKAQSLILILIYKTHSLILILICKAQPLILILIYKTHSLTLIFNL